jgi:hypothetical protein
VGWRCEVPLSLFFFPLAVLCNLGLSLVPGTHPLTQHTHTAHSATAYIYIRKRKSPYSAHMQTASDSFTPNQHSGYHVAAKLDRNAKRQESKIQYTYEYS